MLSCGSFNGTIGTKTITNADGSVSVGTCGLLGCTIVTTVTTTTTSTDTGGFYYVCTTAFNDAACTYHLVANESAVVQRNFAIWYSYYRSRNLNARAAVGRVFSGLGDGSVRVAWQTLQTQTASGSYNTSAGSYAGQTYGPLRGDSKILELANATSCVPSSTADNCWRSQFMNWVYGAPASGGTPDTRGYAGPRATSTSVPWQAPQTRWIHTGMAAPALLASSPAGKTSTCWSPMATGTVTSRPR